MKTPKQPSQTIIPWLKDNLENSCTAPLTGTDARALRAAVQIIELYSYDCSHEVLDAFALVVKRMQPCTYELAYHAIAHVMDWGHRSEIWAMCDLPNITVRRCKYES